jgi:hypothetical protein
MWPMLLDTSALQHLRYVTDLLEEDTFISDEEADELRRRHGDALGDELIALADLMTVLSRNGPEWLVSETSLIEFARASGAEGRSLLQWWGEWADYMASCEEADWYPEIAISALALPRGPEVSEDQLALPIQPAGAPLSPESVPPLGPFRDPGDRALIRDAIRAGVPTILTTDIRSFWRHGSFLRPLGIAVMRPTDVVAAMSRRRVA